MVEYVCKDAVKEELKRYGAEEDFDLIIDSLPAADVRPVVRGRWRWVGQDRWNDCYECLQCGKMNADNSNFCPNCGADMRGGGEE